MDCSTQTQTTYRLVIDDHDVPVHQVAGAAFATITFDGEMDVVVHAPCRIESAVVRPLARDIAHTIAGDALHFTMKEPSYLCVEFNDDLTCPLLIFAEREAVAPFDNEKKLITFGPGEHDAGQIDIPDGGTLYLAEGAWVHGHIDLHGKRDIRILGSGVLDSTGEDQASSFSPITIDQCANVLIDGPILTTYRRWNIIIRRCENVQVRHAKIVSSGLNSDGIDVDGSTRVHVEHCFIKCNDDCIVIKSTPLAEGARVEAVTFQRCVLWKGDGGNGIEIGYELQTDFVRRVRFADIDLLHVVKHLSFGAGWNDRAGALTIHHTGDALVEDVLFENIRVEHVTAPKLICIMVWHYHKSHGWFSPEDRLMQGRIRNVTLRNIAFATQRVPRIHVESMCVPGRISQISLENVTVNGVPITSCPHTIIEQDGVEDLAVS